MRICVRVCVRVSVRVCVRVWFIGQHPELDTSRCSTQLRKPFLSHVRVQVLLTGVAFAFVEGPEVARLEHDDGEAFRTLQVRHLQLQVSALTHLQTTRVYDVSIQWARSICLCPLHSRVSQNG